MRSRIYIVVFLCLLFLLTGCQDKQNTSQEKNVSNRSVLVVYFSNTGTTKQIAQWISKQKNTELYEIEAQDSYTALDLDYNNPSSRSSLEQNNQSSRPKIKNAIKSIEEYDTIILGYPIWHGQAPRIIDTFLESYDFKDKTIIPFCTSHSSGIGLSDQELHKHVSNKTTWVDGKGFKGDVNQDEVDMWIKGLNILTDKVEQNVAKFNFETQRVLLNSGYEMPIAGLGTYSLTDEECMHSITTLLEAGGRLIDTASIYNNEESVGKAIKQSDVPREEIFITTKLYPSQFSDAKNAIDEALKKLDVEYIDLMLLHHPGSEDIDAYKAMEEAVVNGKIRSIGLSNWYVKELQEFLPQVSIWPAVVQNEIHPYYQENDVIPFIHEKGIVVEGWYPFGGRGHTAELLTDKTISKIASIHKVTSAQVILRWNLQKGVVVIPGSSNSEHIKENLDIFDFELTDKEKQEINKLNRDEKHDWY